MSRFSAVAFTSCGYKNFKLRGGICLPYELPNRARELANQAREKHTLLSQGGRVRILTQDDGHGSAILRLKGAGRVCVIERHT